MYLADLGFATNVHNSTNSLVGNVYHMAPEIPAGKYTLEVDIYSFGVLMHFMATGKHAYGNQLESLNLKTFFDKLSKGEIKPEVQTIVNEQVTSMVKRCLAFDPRKRPFWNEIIKTLKSNISVDENTV